MKNINLIRLGDYIINLNNIAYIEIGDDFITITFCFSEAVDPTVYPHRLVFKADLPESKALLYYFERMNVIPDLIEITNTMSR